MQKKAKMSDHLASVLATCSVEFNFFRKRCDHLLKKVIAQILLFFAYLGIDLQLEVESLQNDFVTSDTFTKQVHLVFNECDVDRDNALDTGEFFCAILLLYHKLNKIPYSGRKVPPKRKDVYALFYKFIKAQTEAEERMGLEKSGSRGVETFPKLLTKPISSQKKVKSKITPIITETIKKQKQFKTYLRILKKKMAVLTPYIAATLFYIIFEFVSVVTAFAVNVEVDTQVMKYVIRLVAVYVSTLVLLLIYHSTEIYNTMKHPRSRQRYVRHLTEISQSDTQVRKYINSDTEDLPKRQRTSTLIHEEFIMNKVGDSFMRRETFLFLCQEHFSNLVFSEMWRILWRALIIPIVAWQLNKIVNRGYSLLLVFLNSTLTVSKPIPYQPLPLSLSMSLTMAIFAFIVEPVSASIMWAKLHETLKKDMLTESIDPKTKRRRKTGLFQRQMKKFFRIKETEEENTVDTLMDRMGNKDEKLSKKKSKAKRKSEVKDKIQDFVGLRRRTRELSAIEIRDFKQLLTKARLEDEI